MTGTWAGTVPGGCVCPWVSGDLGWSIGDRNPSCPVHRDAAGPDGEGT